MEAVNVSVPSIAPLLIDRAGKLRAIPPSPRLSRLIPLRDYALNSTDSDCAPEISLVVKSLASSLRHYALRKGEFFHRAITVANSGGPVWQEVTNSAGASTVKGGLVFPANSQALVYDADGNLTCDGIRTYQWDAENRLITNTMTNISGIGNSNRLQLVFGYDYMNRRISKMVSTNSGSGFVPQSTNYFIYDGWNLIAMFTPTGAIQQSFVWGLDLSGTLTNAGGVGGLLAIANSGTNYFASYDGNGNITGLINGTDKSTSARYEYSPFGELIRATGPMARVNPFRSWTKFTDDETGLVYYGYRYYSPTTGRWIGRDPFDGRLNSRRLLRHLQGKQPNVNDPEFLPGGLNLYCFIQNSPTGALDPNGQFTLLDFQVLSMEVVQLDWLAAQCAINAAEEAAESLILVGARGMQIAIAAGKAGASATLAYLAVHPDDVTKLEDFMTGCIPGPPGNYDSVAQVSGSVLSNAGQIKQIYQDGAAAVDSITDSDPYDTQ